MSSIIRNKPYANLNESVSSKNVDIMDDESNKSKKKVNSNSKNKQSSCNDENMAPEYTYHEENSNHHPMKAASPLKRSSSFLKRLGFKNSSSKTTTSTDSYSTSKISSASSNSSIIDCNKDATSTSLENNNYSSPSRNHKGSKKNKFRIQCFGGGKPADMIMLSSSFSSTDMTAIASSSSSMSSPNRKNSKTKKKKRKSLKMMEQRKQVIENDQENIYENNDNNPDLSCDSSTEGSVQKKLKEMKINTPEDGCEDSYLSPTTNHPVYDDINDDTESDPIVSNIHNLDTKNDSMHDHAEVDSLMVSSLASSSSLDLSNNCPTSPLSTEEDPLDLIDHFESSNYDRYTSLLDSDEEEDYDDYSDDNDYDDDDVSCDSTVINSSRQPIMTTRPPLTATKEEQTRFYWELCYGKKQSNNMTNDNKGWSANRAPPTKSCLSTKKKCWSTISKQKKNRAIHNQHTPTLCDRFDFNNIKNNTNVVAKDNDAVTKDPSPLMIARNPKDTAPSVDHLITPYHNRNNINISLFSTRSLTFGPPSAAEFDKTRPTGEFTPLPKEVARICFPIDPIRNEESEEESEEEHAETARNGVTLAAWEDDFDSFLADEESDDERDSSMNTSNNRRRRRSSSDNKNSQRNRRRSSSFFSKSGKPLIKSDNDNISTTDFFKSEELFSPTSSATPNNSSSINQETPNSERTMSSALLRRVHSSGGASLGNARDDIHDYPQQRIQPNQLDSKLQSAEIEQDSQMYKGHHCVNILDRLLIDPKKPVDWNTAEFITELLQHTSDNDRHRELLKEIHIEEKDSSWLLECISSMNVELDSYSEDIVETLEMVVSTLEQQSELNDKNKRMLKLNQTQNSLFAVNETQNLPDNVPTLHSFMLINAKQDWRQMEIKTLSTALEWLSPLTTATQEDSDKLDHYLDLLSSTNLSTNLTKQNSIKSNAIKNDLDTIAILEKQIEEENDKLKHEQAQLNLWIDRIELELSIPVSVIKSLLFCSIVSFEACTVQHDGIDLSFPHMDGSRTMLSWKSTSNDLNFNSDTSVNESISNSDSNISNFGDMMMVHREPLIQRIYDSPFDETNNTKSLQDGIPYPRPQTISLHKEKDKVLRDMYNTLLQDIPIVSIIKDMWEYNASFGIPMSMDIWSRLDLMTIDVAALKRYYKCNFQKNALTKRDEVVVKINYGMDKTIGIRFTYDFVNDPKCALFILPSCIYIYAIQGEPAVPIQVLQQFGDDKINNHYGCNAFILKQICSGVMDKLTTCFRF